MKRIILKSITKGINLKVYMTVIKKLKD